MRADERKAPDERKASKSKPTNYGAESSIENNSQRLSTFGDPSGRHGWWLGRVSLDGGVVGELVFCLRWRVADRSDGNLLSAALGVHWLRVDALVEDAAEGVVGQSIGADRVM
jgi:hypothetical protein